MKKSISKEPIQLDLFEDFFPHQKETIFQKIIKKIKQML